MEQPQNDINKGRLKYSKLNLSQCQSHRQNLTWTAVKQYGFDVKNAFDKNVRYDIASFVSEKHNFVYKKCRFIHSLEKKNFLFKIFKFNPDT